MFGKCNSFNGSGWGLRSLGVFAVVCMWIIGLLLNLALIAGAVWVVVWVLRSLGVIA